MEPNLAARKRLGAEVRQARRRAGYAKTLEWVAKVGRSDRILLGLERGETVGADTYAAVAEALEWPLDRIYAILADEPLEPAGSGSTELTTVSNEELAAEVLRRLRGVSDAADQGATSRAAARAARDAAAMQRDLDKVEGMQLDPEDQAAVDAAGVAHGPVDPDRGGSESEVG